MSYTKRTIVKGSVMETKKMLPSHVHARKAQTKVVGQNEEEKLRWLLNQNFSGENVHVPICYCDRK